MRYQPPSKQLEYIGLLEDAADSVIRHPLGTPPPAAPAAPLVPAMKVPARPALVPAPAKPLSFFSQWLHFVSAQWKKFRELFTGWMFAALLCAAGKNTLGNAAETGGGVSDSALDALSLFVMVLLALLMLYQLRRLPRALWQFGVRIVAVRKNMLKKRIVSTLPLQNTLSTVCSALANSACPGAPAHALGNGHTGAMLPPPAVPSAAPSCKNSVGRDKVTAIALPREWMTRCLNAEFFGRLRATPAAALEKWSVGVATDAGPVKASNEDYALAFEVGGCQVLVIADGMGGVAGGARAAYLACSAAAESLAENLGRYPRSSAREAQAALRMALEAAEDRLEADGKKHAIAGGLRTTLICVLGFAEHYAFAYIGDGGIWCLRANGTLEKLLIPQKADAQIANVLAASLGPVTQGEPVLGGSPRGENELLLAGTDGVFDRVGDNFAKDVLRVILLANGDLNQSAVQVIRELSQAADQAGFFCDDNLSLGLMMSGKAPKLEPGYWKAAGGPTPVSAGPGVKSE